MAEPDLTLSNIGSSVSARRAGTIVTVALVLALLVGIFAGAAAAIDRERDRGNAPCLVDGVLVTNERYCRDVPSYGTIAVDGLLVFMGSGIATFIVVILLTVFCAVGWRVLKWAVSS
jgi:hypothetical protein